MRRMTKAHRVDGHRVKGYYRMIKGKRCYIDGHYRKGHHRKSHYKYY